MKKTEHPFKTSFKAAVSWADKQKKAKKPTKKRRKKSSRAKTEKDKRVPNQKGVGRVTAQGQAIEKLTGFKQLRINKK